MRITQELSILDFAVSNSFISLRAQKQNTGIGSFLSAEQRCIIGLEHL
jgi:hypothetical protein